MAALGAAIPAIAQTGQALIANPLLSPDKVKEVKRQIVEAAHKELAPPPVPAPLPAPLPPPQINPVAMMGSMPGGPSGAEQARQALTRLQVMAIADDTALLATHAPVVAGGTSPMQMPQMPMHMQMSQVPQMQMPGYQQQGIGGQQLVQTSQANPYARRTSSVLVRHREAAFVEGFEVVPIIKGDSVRLVLKSMQNETVFHGSIQPALYSPSYAVAAEDLQKPSTEYVNTAKPDTTSMSGAASYPAPGQQPAPLSIQPSMQFPVQQR